MVVTENMSGESSSLTFSSGVDNIGIPIRSSNFWLNITQLSGIIKHISIIKCDNGPNGEVMESFLVRDFETTLINYLPTTLLLPVMIFTSTMMQNGTCSSCSSKKLSLIRTILLQKHLIFIVYDSLKSLSLSTNSEDWFVYKKSKQSYFIVFIMEKNIEDISCDSLDFEESLKRKAGEQFERFWSYLRLIEVTMVFPVLCQREFVLKYDFLKTFKSKDYSEGVSVLTQNNFKEDPNILLHNYNDFKKYPLKVNAFSRVPTLVKNEQGFMGKAMSKFEIEHTKRTAGLDGFAMYHIEERLNFDVIVRTPTDGQEYGYKASNGTFSGSIGDIIAKRMDISFNARFIKTYGTDDIDFTCPVFYDQFCVLAPKSQKVPTWMSIFLVFSIPVWSVVGVTFIVTGFVWWLMKAKFPEFPVKLSSTFQCFLFLDIFLVLTSQPWAVLPKIDRERFMLTICLLFNLVFAGLFQGYLSTAYSTTTFQKDINTLDELDEVGITISTKNSDIFGGDGASRVGTSLTHKIVPSSGNSSFVAASQRNTCVVERRTDAGLMIQLNFTSRDGQPQLHVVNDCPRSYHLAYIVYKDFPLLSYINRFFQRTVEAGLNDKWYYDTEFSILLKSRQLEEESETVKKLTMVDVQTSFWFLVISLTISIVAFLTEMFIYYGGKLFRRCCRRKSMKYDVDEKNVRKDVKRQRPWLI